MASNTLDISQSTRTKAGKRTRFVRVCEGQVPSLEQREEEERS
jgi:hypothetical protein